MNSLVEMVEEAEREKIDEEIENNANRKWLSLDYPGMNFRGRFVPENEYDPKTFGKNLSPEAKISFEAWLREITTLAVNTEINIQLGEFTIKKHVTQPLEDEIQDNPDFITVFQHITHDDILQCAEVKHTTHRKWVRLIGLDHDVQMWDMDSRQIKHNFSRQYGQSADPDWVKAVVDPWIQKIFPSIQLFYGTVDIARAEMVTLYGVWQNDGDATATMKEFVVFQYPRVLHIYNIIEYGRRYYRSMVFSSHPSLSYHAMPFHAFTLEGDLATCCGDPVIGFEHKSSIVITKYKHDDGDNAQTFLPQRVLYGTIPDTLLESYVFWQNIDDSIVGVLNNLTDFSYNARTSLNITLNKVGNVDTEGYGFSSAYASILRRPLNEENSSKVEVGESIGKSHYLVNPMTLLYHYATHHHSQVFKHTQRHSKYWTEDAHTIHALLRIVLRLEDASHLLLWSTVDPATPLSPTTPFSIDLIELPRLRLSFERRNITTNGAEKIHYYCVEQQGYYLAELDSLKGLRSLINRLPNTVVLRNDLGEYMLLMSAIAKPTQYKLRRGSNFYKLVFVRSDEEWINNSGEMTYFMYPVHASGTMLKSKSIAATLYLLTLYMMTENYREAFKLIDTCVCDRVLTVQEKQIYSLLGNIRNKLLLDSAACRLKLFFVTYGCSDIMPYPFDIDEDLLEYVSHYKSISIFCRLTVDQENFIMSKISEGSGCKTATFVNRERIMKVCFDLTFQKSVAHLAVKNFAAQYPSYVLAEPFHTEVFDVELLDVDKPTFKNILQKLNFAKYTRPTNGSETNPTIQGVECVKHIFSVLEKDKNVGFHYLYELFNNNLPIQILPDNDKPANIGSLLLHILPDSYITGIQRVILLIMETHPELAAKLPVFEDKRRIKLPTFAGLDIFQSHIKAVASYLKQNKNEMDDSKLRLRIPPFFKPPTIINASNDIMMCQEYGHGRLWFSPKVLDFTCEKKMVSLELVPSNFVAFHQYFHEQKLQELMTIPLLTSSIIPSIGYALTSTTLATASDSTSSLAVMNHPSSRSHIARTSVTRLEKDIKDYYSDVETAKTPFMKSLPMDLNKLQTVDFTQIYKEMQYLLSNLESLKCDDLDFVQRGSAEILQFCNGRHELFQDSSRALGHQLLQIAHNEATLVSIFKFTVLYCHNLSHLFILFSHWMNWLHLPLQTI